MIGFGTGLLTSYGFWRLQLHRYDQKINLMFRKIVTNQYSEMKGVPLWYVDLLTFIHQYQLLPDTLPGITTTPPFPPSFFMSKSVKSRKF